MIDPPTELKTTQPVSIEQKKPELDFLYDDGCPFCRRFHDYIVFPLENNNLIWLNADNVRLHQTDNTSWMRYRELNPPVLRVKLPRRKTKTAFAWGARENLRDVRNKVYNYISQAIRVPPQLYVDIPGFEEEGIIEQEKRLRQTGEIYES